jgi:molybdopterin-guanine dinucleotide biosynthesis protein B
MRIPPVFQIIGYKNTGKTTLVCKLTEIFTEKGYKVGTVKHDAHLFDIDIPEKDTWKHRQAGAEIVAIASERRIAVIEERAVALEELVNRMKHVDIIFVEGFKNEVYPKIVMIKSEADLPLLERAENIAAAASWIDITYTAAPVYHVDDVQGMVDQLLKSTQGESL